MADKLSLQRRSWNMSRIKRKDTRPELLVRKELYQRGYRYRINYELEGKPDVVFPRKKIALFIHGCFWHQHRCKDTYRPKTRKKFWNEKLDKNINRDIEVKTILESQGWTVLYVWECEVNEDIENVLNKLVVFI